MLYFSGSRPEFLSALGVTFRTKKTLEACHTRVTPNAGTVSRTPDFRPKNLTKKVQCIHKCSWYCNN